MPNNNRVTIYLKPEDYEDLQKIGRRLFSQGYPVIESNNKVNVSAVISTLIRVASGKEVNK